MRKNFGVKTWIYPQPVLMLGTYDEKGIPNLMNAAWGGIYDYNQIMICLSAHQTTDNIRKNKAFTISFATAETVTASDYVGIVSFKKEKDKIKKSGLKYECAPHIDAPLFTDYPLTLECEVVDIINEGEGGGNIIAKIVNVSADESVLDANGKVDPKKINFVSFDPITSEYRKIGETVALAFREGMKLK
jgi:flavin reductase (DIM6/NTAB) family NADH-FMN oxidoreductase RutF